MFKIELEFCVRVPVPPSSITAPDVLLKVQFVVHPLEGLTVAEPIETVAPTGTLTPFSNRYTIPELAPGRFTPLPSDTLLPVKQTTLLLAEPLTLATLAVVIEVRALVILQPPGY